MLKDCGVAQNSCGFICCASFTLVNFGQLSCESKQSSKTMQISNKLATHCTDIQQKMHRKIALIMCVCLYELIIFKCSNAFPISDCVFRCSKFYTFSQPIFPCPWNYVLFCPKPETEITEPLISKLSLPRTNMSKIRF